MNLRKAGLAFALLVFGTAMAAESNSSAVKFLVLKEWNGKPVRNASVVLHPVGKSGKQSRGGMQLKTDAEGKASMDGVPYGKLRIQVLAPGYQTYGEDFDIREPAKEIVIKMKKPAEQYSIYK